MFEQYESTKNIFHINIITKSWHKKFMIITHKMKIHDIKMK